MTAPGRSGIVAGSEDPALVARVEAEVAAEYSEARRAANWWRRRLIDWRMRAEVSRRLGEMLHSLSATDGTSVRRLETEFPDLFEEIVKALAADSPALIGELKGAEVVRVSFDPDADAGHICLEPARALNVVEQNVIGERYGETVVVDCPYSVNLDLDNFGRPTGIELISPPSHLKSRMR